MAKYDREEVLKFHQGGKVAVRLPKPLKTKDDLCLAYTPGVAHAVKEIAAKPESVYDVTAKSNLVGVVSDGTAILGLGDLGAAASIPVMEGKAVLFKSFGDVDAWPVPLNCCRKDGKNEGKTDPERVIAAVKAIAPQYGGINLEDIASPACFEIEDRLDAELDIPVFHDDQWGTAVISLSGVMNYAKLAGKQLSELKVVMNGAGAAGIRICEMCKAAGVKDVTMCDTKGVITEERTDLNPFKRKHAVYPRAAKPRDHHRNIAVGIYYHLAPALFYLGNEPQIIRKHEFVEQRLGYHRPVVIAHILRYHEKFRRTHGIYRVELRKYVIAHIAAYRVIKLRIIVKRIEMIFYPHKRPRKPEEPVIRHPYARIALFMLLAQIFQEIQQQI